MRDRERREHPHDACVACPSECLCFRQTVRGRNGAQAFFISREGTSDGEMAIHRTTKTNEERTQLEMNFLARLSKIELSLDAYAILIYILGKSDDWEVYSGEVKPIAELVWTECEGATVNSSARDT